MNLWDCAGARARTTDPDTSHKAAADFEASGKGKTHRETILQAVRRWPGRTPAELARCIGKLNYYQVSRRLKELIDTKEIVRGEEKICPIRGTSCSTYYA